MSDEEKPAVATSEQLKARFGVQLFGQTVVIKTPAGDEVWKKVDENTWELA